MRRDSGSSAHSIRPRKWYILAAVAVSLFLGSIDGSIVNVALPTMMTTLQADFPTVQWVVLAYLLGLTVLMVSMGRLADMVGKKIVFVTGLVSFLIGSALCGLAPDVYWLIGFRFVQAIGAAMMLPLGVAIITETWPGSERGKAIGISSGVISMGIVIGPAIGGFLLQWLGWRWIFFVNLPIGIVALLLVMLFVPVLPARNRNETFDVAGAIVLGLGLLAFTLALTVGQNVGFTTPAVLALFVAFGVAVLGFLRIEQSVRYPMLDLSLFREAQFSLNLFTGWLTFVTIAGIVLLLPFYLELVLDLSLRDVGLMMAVVPIVMGLIQPFTGTISDRVGTRAVSAVGLVIMALGYLAMTTLRVDGSPLGFILRMLPVSIGIATFHSPNNSAIMGSAPRHRLGVASGILSMVRILGQIVGIAVLGAFFAYRLQIYGGEGIELRTATPQTIVAAMHDQFWLVTVLTVVGLAASLWTWRREIEAARMAQQESVASLHSD